MTIQAIIFDLDDTLVVDVAAAEAAFLAACELAHSRYGLDSHALYQSVRFKARELWRGSDWYPYCAAIGISSWEGLWARFEGDDPNLQALRAWAPTYRHTTWLGALAEHGVDDRLFADQLADAYQTERRARQWVHADAEPVLAELARLYRLALLTNGAPDLQREKIAASGLESYFDVTIVSGELGVGKPDPRIFALTLERLGVGAEAAVMVGNSLKSDIAGAKQAGLKTIWLNRTGAPREDDIEPDAQISQLGELGKILSR